MITFSRVVERLVGIIINYRRRIRAATCWPGAIGFRPAGCAAVRPTVFKVSRARRSAVQSSSTVKCALRVVVYIVTVIVQVCTIYMYILLYRVMCFFFYRVRPFSGCDILWLRNGFYFFCCWYTAAAGNYDKVLVD